MIQVSEKNLFWLKIEGSTEKLSKIKVEIFLKSIFDLNQTCVK